MTIIRWQNRPLWSSMLDNWLENEGAARLERNCGCVPATNILEKENEYVIELAAPGLKKEDFALEVKESMLLVTYDKKEDKETEDNYLRREFGAEGFSRSFSLPKQVEADKVKARYENGILQISIPRENEEKARLSRQIKIS